jgi:thiol-disulfide isomerase/thioredoxin
MTTTSTPTPAPPASGPGPDGRSPRRWLTIAGAAVVTLLVLAVTYTALSSQPAPTSTAGAASTTARSSNAATAFTATTLSGDQVTVPGGKPSLVFFFSATCGSCGPGARALAEAQASTPGANYVAVDIDPSESVAVVRSFLTANGASTLAYARDTDAALTRAYELTQLSTAVVLDASGTEVYRGVDPTPAQIRAALTKAGVA